MVKLTLLGRIPPPGNGSGDLVFDSVWSQPCPSVRPPQQLPCPSVRPVWTGPDWTRETPD